MAAISSHTPLLVLSFSLLILPSLSLAVSRCNPNEEKVLLEIKESLGNPLHLDSWTPDTDCCDWYGLDCDLTTGRVISLTIYQANISAQIPSAIGDLPYLQNLMFHKITNLTGSIPASIVKLRSLKFLQLSWTNLSGPIPSFLGQMKNLTFLQLSYNNFSGSIPPSLSLLPNLNALHLDRNRLTGPIPDSFGNFSANAPDLYLSHNQLSGPVPRSLARLNLTQIDLSRNKLVGDVSFLFGPNKSVQIVDLSRNFFEFNLTAVKFPKNLKSLNLNHNKITGTLPAEATILNLQYLNVSYNRLCGQIPIGGRLQVFGSTAYVHNRCLTGAPLPSVE